MSAANSRSMSPAPILSIPVWFVSQSDTLGGQEVY